MSRTLPVPRTPDPMDAPPLRWGVMGTGWIAQRFTEALHTATRQRVTAVASRGSSRAPDFAARFGIPASFTNFDDLAASDVDVIYVATEHTTHLSCARSALLVGKHVLVEKPLGINASQAREITDLAAERDLFCMEAFWSYFLPKFDVIRQLLDERVLGEIHALVASNGEDLTQHRRALDPAKAGGPMLDLGTYVFGLAHWVLGPQRLVAASGQWLPSGVNGQLSALFTDPPGRQTVLHTSALAASPVTATVAGSAATLVLRDCFYQPGGFDVRFANGDSLEWDEPEVGHRALFWQAAEVARCISAGLSQSLLRPLSDSIATLETMDRTRARLGIRFPGEPPAIATV